MNDTMLNRRLMSCLKERNSLAISFVIDNILLYGTIDTEESLRWLEYKKAEMSEEIGRYMRRNRHIDEQEDQSNCSDRKFITFRTFAFNREDLIDMLNSAYKIGVDDGKTMKEPE